MRSALHAEWTKLRTTAGPAWLLLAAVAATVAAGAAVTAVVACPHRGCDLDPVRLSLTGVYLGQAPVAILAVLAVSGEYSTGLIRVTLTAVPRRAAVLAAKATILTLTVAAAGGVALLATFLTAREIRPPGGGPALRAYAGSDLYLVLLALLSLGVAAAVRDSATAVGTVLGLLYLPPILAGSIADPHWQRLLHRVAPMSGGLAVLAAWAAGALLIGTVLVHRRDT